HVSQSHRPGNRDAVADEVEGKPFVERRVDGVVRADEDDSVTIWRSAECGLHADIAARTDPVLDDELLAQMIRQILADDARNDVVGAARRKANNPVHWPRRIAEFCLISLLPHPELIAGGAGVSLSFPPRKSNAALDVTAGKRGGRVDAEL